MGDMSKVAGVVAGEEGAGGGVMPCVMASAKRSLSARAKSDPPAGVRRIQKQPKLGCEEQ